MTGVLTPGGVDEQLKAAAAAFATALPASVTLPAGAGKTHLLAATVRHLVADGHSVLVLTHTNAGVQAVRRRLKRFGVTAGVRVATLTSFAFLLARAYSSIGQLKVPCVPNWNNSAAYVAAARRIAAASNIRDILAASYTHLLVDEYQDCSESQHEFVTALADAISKTGVLGDPMQAIFSFGEPLVTWEATQARFPDHPTDSKPWRWTKHNQTLGQWLFDLRSELTVGKQLTFSRLAPGLGISFRSAAGNYLAVKQAALWHRWPSEESVVVLTAWKQGARRIGADLDGTFTVMEELAGEFMTGKLAKLAMLAPAQYASWLLELTKDCLCGNGKLNDAVKKALGQGRTVGHVGRPGLEPALAGLDAVVANPCYATMADAMDVITRSPSLRLHSREAWRDIQLALRGAAAAGDDPQILTEELARARDRVRRVGRHEGSRVVSRTLLVKGLEYDHVVIANVEQLTDVNNLYVALTRARRSITVIGITDTITLT